MKKINFALASLIDLGLIANVSALEKNLSYCPAGGMMYGFNGSYGLGAIILSWITYLLFIILIIVGIYWLIKSANNKNNGGKK